MVFVTRRAQSVYERRATLDRTGTGVPRGGLRRAGLVIAGCDAVLYGTGASRRPVATNRVGGKEERPQEW
jgi:hypothetical protein